MISDATFDTLRTYGGMPCTAQFWLSETPARAFDTLQQCLAYLAEETHEALPDVHVHASTGEIALNGPQLNELIATAKATRSAT